MADTTAAPAAAPAPTTAPPAAETKAPPAEAKPTGQRSNLPPAPKAPAQPITPKASETEGLDKKTGAAAITPPEGKKEPEELFELTVNGKVEKLTREQAVRELQKGRAAGEKFKSAAEMTRKAQQLFQALEGDHAGDVLEQILGDRFDTIAEQRMARRAEQALLTPEEREHASLQRKLADYEAREQQRQEQEQKAQVEQQSNAMVQHLDKAITAIANKGNLPGTPETLAAIAEVLMEADDIGLNMTEEQVAAEVQEKLDGVSKNLEQRILGGLKGDALLDRVGPTIAQAIVDATVARFNTGNPYAPPPVTEPEPEPAKAVRYNSHAELMDALRKKGISR